VGTNEGKVLAALDGDLPAAPWGTHSRVLFSTARRITSPIHILALSFFIIHHIQPVAKHIGNRDLVCSGLTLVVPLLRVLFC
jgi:hypothetical protein